MGWLLYIELRLEKLKENSEIISISPEGIQRIPLLKFDEVQKGLYGWMLDFRHKKSSHEVTKPHDYSGIFLNGKTKRLINR